MKTFGKILCALDFSEPSRQALGYARVFADIFDAELTLIHVTPDIAQAYTGLMPDYRGIQFQTDSDILARLNEFGASESGDAQKVIRAGTPHVEILDYAKREHFDLIIIGAKGHSPCERLFLGTTGERVAMSARCPVLTVHPKPEGLPLRRILIPIDFSARSYAVLPTVASLAERFSAEIYLLHVIEIGRHLDEEGQTKEYEFFEQVKERLYEEWDLHDFSYLHRATKVKKYIRHHVGSAAYGIVEFAHDWDIDLIVMSTHGRSGLSKMLMGSVTEKVIRISSYPVLSLRSDFKEPHERPLQKPLNITEKAQ